VHVALIANTAWLDENLTMYQSMVVGLMDEQVRVVQVVPEGVCEGDVSAFSPRLTWRDSQWEIIRRHRLRRKVGELREMAVDVIHALDGREWSGALKLAKQIWTPVVLGASSAMDVSQVDRVLAAKFPMKIAFFAATRPLAEAIQERIGPDGRVDLMPQGVHVPEYEPMRDSEEAVLCAVVTGNGTYDAHYDALLVALRSIVAKHPQAQFFFDGQGNDQRHIWQSAKRYGLLSNMSLVPRRLGRRELLLRADLLIQPQALGRSRTITLRAMAHGVPVMAVHDSWLDYLIDQQTAWVVEKSDPAVWVSMIERFIEAPHDNRLLAQRASQWVSEHHLASNQIEQMIRMYREISGESIKFSTGSFG